MLAFCITSCSGLLAGGKQVLTRNECINDNVSCDVQFSIVLILFGCCCDMNSNNAIVPNSLLSKSNSVFSCGIDVEVVDDIGVDIILLCVVFNCERFGDGERLSCCGVDIFVFLFVFGCCFVLVGVEVL